MAAVDDLEEVVEQYHLTLGGFLKGDPQLLQMMYSHREDVTLANPFGPPTRGWGQVAATMERAASHYRDGEIVNFENVAKYETAELGYIVEVERYQAKVGEMEDIIPVTVRVTTILRPEDGAWKVVHRHADPITTAQPAESVIQK